MMTADPNNTGSGELTLALPAVPLFGLAVAGPILVALVWFIVCRVSGYDAVVVRSGLVGCACTLATAIVGVAVMTPWKTRAMSDWMTMWLAATVLRLLATPVVAYVVYSATSLNAKPFVLALAGAYVFTLFAEAVLLSVSIKRHL